MCSCPFPSPSNKLSILDLLKGDRREMARLMNLVVQLRKVRRQRRERQGDRGAGGLGRHLRVAPSPK